MFECPERLTTFFRELIPSARAAGYKCIVTLLAREADSEDIFRDVKRYWSSLHDVTGEHVLFALGAHNAASEVSGGGIQERREPVVHVNRHAAYTGARTVFWPGRSFSWQQLRQGHVKPSDDIACSHSLEISALRDMFGLREHTIPAILIFALTPDSSINPSVILPLSALHGDTIYIYLKNLVADLDEQFTVIERARERTAEHRRRLDKLPNYDTKMSHMSVKLTSVKDIPEAKAAADQIIAICSSSTKERSEKRRCFDLLRIIGEAIGKHATLTVDLQRLIDVAFFRGSPQWLACRDRKDDLERQIQECLEQEQVLWRVVLERLQDRRTAPPKEDYTPMDGWDYFIAYSSKDYWYADRLFKELAKTGKVFLDRLSLRPGDVWPVRLREEQNKARCTVVLLTDNTDQAWFATSECIHAIELAKQGCHRIVPILVGDRAKLPYGLDQIHAIKHKGYNDFKSTVREIADSNKQ